MRILVLSDKSPTPSNSGGALAVKSMIRTMQEGGAQTDLLSITTQKHPHKKDNFEDHISEEVEFHTIHINTRVKPFSLIFKLIFSPIPYNYSRFWSPKMEQVLINLLTQNKYDIVQLEGLNLAPYIKTIKDNCDSLIVFRAHNVEHKIWNGPVYGNISLIKRIFLKSISNKMARYEIESIKKCDALVTISLSDQTFFKSMGISNPSINIPYAIASLPEYLSSKSNNFTLGIIASLDWTPNQEGLIWFLDKVWSSLAKTNPEVKLKIAGRNSPKWLKSRIIKENIEFLGEVKSADDFVQSCSVIVIPLLRGSGMRIRIIEALSYGRPVVTTKIGLGALQISNEDGVFVSDSPDEFGKHISMLAADDELRGRININAREYINRNHLISKLAPELNKIYTKILA